MYDGRAYDVVAMTTPAEKFAAAKVRNQYKETTAFVQSFDFEFDPFQVAACHAVEEGSGVLVAAPTGAGKLSLENLQLTLHSNWVRNVSTPRQSRLFQIRNTRSLLPCLVKIESVYSLEIPA